MQHCGTKKQNHFVLITQRNARISPYVKNVLTIRAVNSVMPVSIKGWSGDLVIPMRFVYSSHRRIVIRQGEP